MLTAIFHRAPRLQLPEAVAASGMWLEDRNGKRYLDASGGAAVSSIGHGHPHVTAAICRQAQNLAYAHTAFFTNKPSEDLAEFLVDRAPDGIGRAYFLSGGSEAVETALKLARAYHVARGEIQRNVFIARRQSYHGATIGALSVSGNPARRATYDAILPAARFAAPCYPYREQRPGESLEDYGSRAASDLERVILEAGAENVAAFIAEPVVGATLGAVAAVPGYLKKCEEICRRHGVLFIADEVMCGMGRTGSLFSCDHDGVSPDMIVLAKGLGGGYQPIGAVLTSERIYQAIVEGPGAFEHGHTYIGHPIACAAALAVQEVVEQDSLVARVAANGPELQKALRTALKPMGILGEVRGRGHMIGVELVEDPVTRKPFSKSLDLARRIKSAAMEHGLIVYPGSGTVDGTLGDHILVAPPYIATKGDIDEIADRLRRALEGCLYETAR